MSDSNAGDATSGVKVIGVYSKPCRPRICPWPLPNQVYMVQDELLPDFHPSRASKFRYCSEIDEFKAEMDLLVLKVADLFRRRKKQTEAIENWLLKSPTKSAKDEAKKMRAAKDFEDTSFIEGIIDSMDL